MLRRLLTLRLVPGNCTMFWLTDGLTDTAPVPLVSVVGEYCPDPDEYVSTCPFTGALDATGTL
jgi:hypothetical protein